MTVTQTITNTVFSMRQTLFGPPTDQRIVEHDLVEEDVDIANPNDFPTNEYGIPMVPQEEVIGVFPEQSAWGNRIGFSDFSNRRVNGHMTPNVKDGDIFAYRMESGAYAAFEVYNVENSRNPGDLFFADVWDVGYLKSQELDQSRIAENTRFSHGLL